MLRRLILLAAAFGVTLANAQPPVPPGGVSLLGGHPPALQLLTAASAADAGALTLADLAGPGFTQAHRLETKSDSGPVWAITARTPIPAAVKKGDVALLRFFARATFASDETGGGQLRIAVRKGGDTSGATDSQFTVGKTWQEFFVPFTFPADFAAGELELALGAGYKRQTLEIGGCDLLGYGTRVAVAALPRTRFTYVGREPDATWRKDALARIERIRKGDFAIKVVNALGEPVPGARMHIEQQRAAFQFGSALQFERLVRDTPDNRRYRELVLELFNAASPENDLKWPVWLGEWEGPYDRDQSLRALRWLREHQLPTRGHVLVWPSWRNLPNAIGALKGTPRENDIPGRVLEHIAQMTAATNGLLDEWDVLNEPWDNHDLMDQFGRDIMVDWFVAARRALPTAPLYLNDYSNHDATTDRAHVEHFEATTRFLLEKQAPVTGLGLQAHIGTRPNAPVNVLAVLDRYAKFGLPLRVTEFDINTDDEALQADYTRDFLTLMFSHPSVVGVQLWGFWENAHWRPRAAMFRADWSAKPNAKAYRDLVLNQWRTRLDERSGANGIFAARGFHGDYVVTVQHAGRNAEAKFSLVPGAPVATVEVKLP